MQCPNLIAGPLSLFMAFAVASFVLARPPHVRAPKVNPVEPRSDTDKKIGELIGEVREPEVAMRIVPRRSKLIRFKQPVLRVSNSRPNVLKIIFYSRTEAEFIGLKSGVTNVTLWFPPSRGETRPRVLKFSAGSVNLNR